MAAKKTKRATKRPPIPKKTKKAPPPRRSRKATSPKGQKKKATGFAAIVRGVADAAVQEDGVGSRPEPLHTLIPKGSMNERPQRPDKLQLVSSDNPPPRRPMVRVSAKSKAVKPPRPAGKGAVASSMPEISIDYRPGGRETMAAIEEELASQGQPAAPKARPTAPRTQPKEEEPPTGIRARKTTLGFEDRPIRDDDGRLMSDSMPEVITIEQTPVGRATLDAIAREAAHSEITISETPAETDLVDAVAAEAMGNRTMDIEDGEVFDEEAPASESRARAGLFIHELVTFVVEGADLDALGSQEERIDFVASHLMHRLPVWSPEDIERVDMTPAQGGRYAVLQVWCRLSAQGS